MTTNTNHTILIYGANGYTGRLLAQHYVDRGQRPILAGRGEAVRAVAQRLGCPARVFGIDQADAHLQDVDLLINTAGPFAKTQVPLLEACLQTGTHYLDLAGEVAEVEQAAAYAQAAEQAGIVLLPAAGFGVAPTDVAARLVSQQVEQPTHLRLAYATVGGASQGTVRTVLSGVHEPGVERQGGRLVAARPAQRTWQGRIGKTTYHMVYHPWRADLVTAYRSTGIPNIETYATFPALVVQFMKGRFDGVRKLLLRYGLGWLPEGPSEKALAEGATYIHAEAWNAAGQRATVQLQCPDAYVVTVACAAELAAQVLTQGGSGWKTPSDYGTAWLLTLPGIQQL